MLRLLQTNSSVRSVPGTPLDFSTDFPSLANHTDIGSGVAFSGDGQTLAITSKNSSGSQAFLNIFKKVNDKWIEKSHLTLPNLYAITYVTLDFTGETVVTTGYYNPTNVGALPIYAYRISDDGFTTLLTDNAGYNLNIKLSDDGLTLLVAKQTSSSSAVGVLSVFKRASKTVSFSAILHKNTGINLGATTFVNYSPIVTGIINGNNYFYEYNGTIFTAATAKNFTDGFSLNYKLGGVFKTSDSFEIHTLTSKTTSTFQTLTPDSGSFIKPYNYDQLCAKDEGTYEFIIGTLVNSDVVLCHYVKTGTEFVLKRKIFTGENVANNYQNRLLLSRDGKNLILRNSQNTNANGKLGVFKLFEL